MGSEYFAGYITEKALVGRQPLRLPHHHVELPGAPGRPAEGAALRHRLLAHRPHRVHLRRRRAHQPVRLGLLPVRPRPAAHGRQHAQARGRGQPLRRQHRHPAGQADVPHDRPLRRRPAVHPGRRPAGHDADAPRDDRDRWHRHPLRPRLDPRDLRPDPERLRRLHRHGVLAPRPAPALLPHRRAARPAHLPVLRSGRDPRLHRRQARAARPAREQRAVHQRRQARGGRRDQHRAVAQRHPRRAGRHRRGLAHQPARPGPAGRVQPPPPRRALPRHRLRGRP